jgi:hypothetical protein
MSRKSPERWVARGAQVFVEVAGRFGPHVASFAVGGDPKRRWREERNARLAAAAPDLLSVLKHHVAEMRALGRVPFEGESLIEKIERGTA